VLELDEATEDQGVTKLPALRLQPNKGRHDLCFLFTRANVDPIWAIDRVTLLDAASVN
jgi:hypothetical protein